MNDSHIVVTGYGLTIYDIKTKKLVEFWNEPNREKYSEGLYLPSFADEYQFGFVMSNDSKDLRVFMGNAKTLEFQELK